MERLYNIAGKEIALFLFRFDLVGSKGVDIVLNVEIYHDMYADIDQRMKPLIHACSETLLRYRKHYNSTTIMDGTIHFDGMFEVVLSKGLRAIIDPKEQEQLFEDARRISDLLKELMIRRTKEERGELPPLDFMDEPASDDEVKQGLEQLGHVKRAEQERQFLEEGAPPLRPGLRQLRPDDLPKGVTASVGYDHRGPCYEFDHMSVGKLGRVIVIPQGNQQSLLQAEIYYGTDFPNTPTSKKREKLLNQVVEAINDCFYENFA